MTDIIYYKNGKETFRISPPTDEIKCPKTKLEIKMNDIEKLKQEIKMLQSKVEFLQSIEEHKDQEMRKAFKDDYGYAPYRNELSWVGFQKGWEASQKNQNNIEEIIDNPTTIPEPKMSEFRQKLFDGIKSVFYDPEYERTHWKMKVNMAVDEVLTHFLEELPEPDEYIGDYGPSQEYVDGWNHYYEIINEKLQGY